MSRIFKVNMPTLTETIKLTDLYGNNKTYFFLSVSFVSVKVGIFTLNMRDIIIYLAR